MRKTGDKKRGPVIGCRLSVKPDSGVELARVLTGNRQPITDNRSYPRFCEEGA
jgi:hypothetical protein